LSRRELSGPAGLDYTDVTISVATTQIVVDVGAAGVSFPDLLLLRGEYQMRLEPPFVPGMEVAGVVRSAPYESEFNRANGLRRCRCWGMGRAVMVPSPT
jgi:NADPH2:quinone reductase